MVYVGTLLMTNIKRKSLVADPTNTKVPFGTLLKDFLAVKIKDKPHK